MADPATTPRVESSGLRQLDGFRTQIAFSLDPNVAFWETDVQPFGYDVGDKIPTSTMFNTRFETFEPRELIEILDGGVVAAFDPLVFTEILSLLGRRGSVTIHFPDLSTMDVFAYLKSFVPQAQVKGQMPLADIVVVVTNYDPVNNVEQGPVVTEVAGTP